MQETVRKPSPMQMKAINHWRSNGFKSNAVALWMAGYGKSVKDQPHKVFGSPTVIRELMLQGLDEWGRRTPPQAIVLDEHISEPHPTTFDFSKIPQEWLRVLKQKLDSVSASNMGEEGAGTRSYVPAEDVVDIFSAGPEQYQQVSRKQLFSSM